VSRPDWRGDPELSANDREARRARLEDFDFALDPVAGDEDELLGDDDEGA
jgi:hypothetical protein